MTWDISKLKSLSAHERHRLWQNAKAKSHLSDQAADLVKKIESSGLDFLAGKTKSVSLDDKIGRTMRRIIFSEIGIQAMLKATEAGLPALGGVDPLLQAELANDYSKLNEATVQAGYLVKKVMVSMGYKPVGHASLPAACVAKTGMLFSSSEKT
jgi:hypothetical protein